MFGRHSVYCSASVEVGTEAVSLPPPLPWDAQSGQHGSEYFEKPLVGKPMPLGASLVRDRVRETCDYSSFILGSVSAEAKQVHSFLHLFPFSYILSQGSSLV